jgi:hypothetical protein
VVVMTPPPAAAVETWSTSVENSVSAFLYPVVFAFATF